MLRGLNEAGSAEYIKSDNHRARVDAGPARKLVAVTPGDATVLPDDVRGLYIGGGGNIAIRAADDTTAVTLTGVLAGTFLPIAAVRVLSTGTTATSIVALI